MVDGAMAEPLKYVKDNEKCGFVRRRVVGIAGQPGISSSKI